MQNIALPDKLLKTQVINIGSALFYYYLCPTYLASVFGISKESCLGESSKNWILSLYYEIPCTWWGGKGRTSTAINALNILEHFRSLDVEGSAFEVLDVCRAVFCFAQTQRARGKFLIPSPHDILFCLQYLACIQSLSKTLVIYIDVFYKAHIEYAISFETGSQPVQHFILNISTIYHRGILRPQAFQNILAA